MKAEKKVSKKPQGPIQGRVSQVSIEGFRNLVRIENLELPQMALLIGANGAGKSNFIRFFEMLGWILKGQNFQEFVQRQGGADNLLFMGAKATHHIRATIRLSTHKGWNDYRFALTHLPADDSLIFVEEAYRYSDKTRSGEALWNALSSGTREGQLPLAIREAPTPNGKTTARTVTHLLRQCVTYQFHDTSPAANIKKPWDITENARLRSDGANLAPVLLNLFDNDPRAYSRIVQRIQRVLPSFLDFVLEPNFGKILLRWRSKHGDKTFGPDSTSDGSLRLFCLVTLLSLPDEMLPDVLFLDEPELGLHPFAIQLVAAMMRSLSATRQIIASTQSVTLVNEFSWENLIVADQIDGTAHFRRLDEQGVASWLELYQIGEMWEKNILGGTPE